MSRLFDDAASEYLEHDAALMTAVPITMACWIYSDDAAANQCAVGICASGSSNSFTLELAGGLDGDPILASSTAGGTARNAPSTSGYSVNTWHHICAVFAAADNRSVYIDGGSKGTNTQNSTPGGTIDRTVIGRRTRVTPINYVSGRVAEVGIWNVALSDNEVVRLARGEAPLFIRPENLKFYCPTWGFNSPEPDLSGFNQHMIVNGPIAAEHPPGIVPFPARYGLWRPPLLMR